MSDEIKQNTETKVEDTASNGEVVSTENATGKCASPKVEDTGANGTELAGETGSIETDDGPAPKKQKTEEKEKECEASKEKEKEETKEDKEDEKENDEKKQEFSKENPSTIRKSAAEKCPECDYKCWTDAEMKVHRMTSHGAAPRRMRMCSNCNFTCQNTWEMDYHARSRGHKAKEVLTCKKCDFLCETKQEAWAHKKVHIPADRLFECGDCSWCGDRLDNIRYHVYSQEHKTKEDYEAVAKAKAEAKGPKELKHYMTKLAKDMKKALSQKK